MNKSVRRTHIILCFAVLFVCLATDVYAQKITDSLKEVKVRAQRKPTSNDARINLFSPGQKITSIDSITLQQYQYQSIANLLSQQVPVFVRSYGFNNLATLNFRGSSAAQSQVLWNGVPIQNAALGMADVSLLPVLLIDKVSVVYGGSAALWGSGNVGGALCLENNPPVFHNKPAKSLSLSAGGGSYGQYLGGANAGFSNKRWSIAAKAFMQNATNNFSYTDANGIRKPMSNATLNGMGGVLQTAYKVNEKNTLTFDAWYQQYERRIPPALFEAASAKRQQDRSLRMLLGWNRHTEKNTWYAKASLTRDFMDYRDTMSAVHSRNVTWQYFQDIGFRRKVSGNSNLMIFMPVQLSWIDIQTTQANHTQSRLALAAAYNVHWFADRLNLAINARGEHINGNNIFLPGANASYALTHWLSLKGNVQRTYRYPTLNELYYVPGGNSSLKPEQGWSEDAGYAVKLKVTPSLTLQHDVSVFNRVIDDWIIWFGGSIWTPHNIATVHSRGVETENNLQWQMRRVKWHLGFNTAYVRATTQASYMPYDGSIGKQIPYSPLYNGQANVGFIVRGIYFNYNHTYTGYRYITIDESSWLLPYNTGNIQLSYDLSLNRVPCRFSLRCNNVWDHDYQVVGFRPMPGINWQADIRITLAR